ncbi:unnamed protein product [Vitrella brassicaformis CCMP3155]|uniref:Glycosyltransferase family 92 protein n=2 Tax=Vitrella brassicaformis TaxID=1169539 RepID=A0A0G4EYT1_VITBC|nr:unnamed protein product [Vitrella brassicaformis CCMP3155]|eukprot:CEM04101.1 unnamed protein product [Vitrella brassicaformis CCMP3155]
MPEYCSGSSHPAQRKQKVECFGSSSHNGPQRLPPSLLAKGGSASLARFRIISCAIVLTICVVCLMETLRLASVVSSVTEWAEQDAESIDEGVRKAATKRADGNLRAAKSSAAAAAAAAANESMGQALAEDDWVRVDGVTDAWVRSAWWDDMDRRPEGRELGEMPLGVVRDVPSPPEVVIVSLVRRKPRPAIRCALWYPRDPPTAERWGSCPSWGPVDGEWVPGNMTVKMMRYDGQYKEFYPFFLQCRPLFHVEVRTSSAGRLFRKSECPHPAEGELVGTMPTKVSLWREVKVAEAAQTMLRRRLGVRLPVRPLLRPSSTVPAPPIPLPSCGPPPTYRRTLAVCVRPYWGSPNPLTGEMDSVDRIVEFVETFRALGAELFTFYESHFPVSASVRALLDLYEQEGLVEVVRWRLPVRPYDDVWDYAQVAQINECRLRHLDTMFLLYADLDEAIFPYLKRAVDQQDAAALASPPLLPSLLMDLSLAFPESGAFIFRNHFFFTEEGADSQAPRQRDCNISGDEDSSLYPSAKAVRLFDSAAAGASGGGCPLRWQDVLWSLQRSSTHIRSGTPRGPNSRAKVVVRPRRLKTAFVHHVQPEDFHEMPADWPRAVSNAFEPLKRALCTEGEGETAMLDTARRLGVDSASDVDELVRQFQDCERPLDSFSASMRNEAIRNRTGDFLTLLDSKRGADRLCLLRHFIQEAQRGTSTDALSLPPDWDPSTHYRLVEVRGTVARLHHYKEIDAEEPTADEGGGGGVGGSGDLVAASVVPNVAIRANETSVVHSWWRREEDRSAWAYVDAITRNIDSTARRFADVSVRDTRRDA